MSKLYYSPAHNHSTKRYSTVDEGNIEETTKDMLDILKLDKHSEVVSKVFEGIGDNFYVFTDKLWTVLVPKNPSNVYMPMLCAHTDTVGNIHPKSFSYTDDTRSSICNTENKLIGADDRLGCYVISQLVKSNPNDFIFALFDLEETGGIGSSNFAKSEVFSTVTSAVSCFLGLDRRGSSDLASYQAESEEFLEVLKGIPDFYSAFGTFTDVMTLAEASNISCTNFSVGYYNEHTPNEYFTPSECLNTLDTLKKLPKELWETQYKFEDTLSYYKRFWCDGDLWSCDCCGDDMGTDDEKYETSEGYVVCERCIRFFDSAESTAECPECNQMFIKGTGELTMFGEVCPDCAFTRSNSSGKKVNLYKFLDFIDYIVSNHMWDEYGERRRDVPPATVRQIMKDINFLSATSRYDELRQDQFEKIEQICNTYDYFELFDSVTE